MSRECLYVLITWSHTANIKYLFNKPGSGDVKFVGLKGCESEVVGL